MNDVISGTMGLTKLRNELVHDDIGFWCCRVYKGRTILHCGFQKTMLEALYAISTLLIMNNYISGSVVRLYMEHVKVANRFASASRINFKLIHR